MLGADKTTTHRLRLLQAEFTQHTQRGPGDGRSSRPTEAPAPLDLGTIDYMQAAAAEVVQHTRAVVPGVDPYSGPAADVYEWAREHTANLDEQRLRAHDALVYRQGLEHAIRMGNAIVIRKHPCPECGCLGLYWREETGKAACVNHYCVDDDGVSRAWTLEYLAQQYIAAKSGAHARAT